MMAGTVYEGRKQMDFCSGGKRQGMETYQMRIGDLAGI
jgi:hypothetical protein